MMRAQSVISTFLILLPQVRLLVIEGYMIRVRHTALRRHPCSRRIQEERSRTPSAEMKDGIEGNPDLP
jgi:hypothetical protein